MRFISPKTDFAFKKIFGSEDSKDILISLLNALIYDNQNTIQSIEIIDPYAASQLPGLKDTYLDVKAKINDNTTVIIEMQVLNVASFSNRVVYNAAKTYATQLKYGEGYMKLKPVIALTITDFEMFPNQESAISHFVFQETKRKFEYPDCHLELVFVELPKFNKQLAELENIQDKWIYFLKNAPDLETVPETMGAIPAIQKALTIANQANLSVKELEDLDKREMFLEDQRGLTLKGIEQGIQSGQADIIIRQLIRRLGTIDPEIKNRIRQLPTVQLENLAEAVLDFTNVSDLMTWFN